MAQPLLAGVTAEDWVFVHYSPDEEIAAAGVVAPRSCEWHERLLLERVVADSSQLDCAQPRLRLL
eukprot:2598458-Amphidinium_carterae.1